MSAKKKRTKDVKHILSKVFSGNKKEQEHVEYGPLIVTDMSENAKKEQSEETKEERQNYKLEFNRKYFIICTYALGTIAVAALAIYGIMNLASIKAGIGNFLSIISTFIAAFFLAFIMNPLVKSLEERFFGNVCKIKTPKRRLILAILVSYVIVIGIISVGLVYVIPQITNSAIELGNRLSDPKLYTGFTDYFQNIEDNYPSIDFDFIEAKLGELLPKLISYGTDFIKNVLPMLLDVSISIAKTTLNVFLTIAISIYMLYDKRMLTKHSTRVVYALIPKKKADRLLEILKECSSIFTSFVVGKSIDSLIIGIICFVVMSIMKLPYAVLLSVIVGITNMIPYFGPFIGAVPGIVLYLCISPLNAIAFALMILVLQQFDGWILGPKILGDSTGLTPLWVIFGITVGGAYGGVIGMFLGVPVVAVLAYLANLFITGRLKKKKLDIS
ncbi:MAG: AI-2E family transporter [Lachnospiraceae bacterium]|nr:AI-2E family transporter [Lachnospiraceae bacterium]